jgi:probable addiction module antidote protein
MAKAKGVLPYATRYDVADHLRTPPEMAAYLDAWLTDAPDDAAGIARALGDIARAKGMTQVAKDAGLSRESLYRALSEVGNPSFATILKVARAEGSRLQAVEAKASFPQKTDQNSSLIMFKKLLCLININDQARIATPVT